MGGLSQPGPGRLPAAPAGMSRRSRPVAHRRSVFRARMVTAGKGTCGVAVAIGIWELAHRAFRAEGDALPSFFTMVSHLFTALPNGLGDAIAATTQEWALSSVLAIVAGGLIGTVAGLSALVDASTESIFDFFRAIPPVAYIPVAVVVLGIGSKLDVTIIVFTMIWPIFFNAKAAVQEIDPLIVESAGLLGVKGYWSPTRIVRVLWPAGLARFLTGVSIALPLGLIVSVSIGLVVGGNAGLGSYINNLRQSGLYADVWAGILATSIVGYLANLLMSTLINRITPWQGAKHE